MQYGSFTKAGGDGVVHINGQDTDAAGRTIQEYLEENGYVSGRFVVEYNMKIIPKEDYQKTVLQDGDVVEIVSFMGGGSFHYE